jgi:sterol desaturase/sphingolipid hydroxylase (fatty acid hydroxylase superfamily)
MNLFDWKGFLLLLVIFVPLERLIALHPEQKLFRKGWWNDLIYVAVNGWFIKAGTLTVVVLGVVAARALIPPSWQEAVAAQPWWLQLAEVLVIADAGFYLMHRAFHAVPWLWQTVCSFPVRRWLAHTMRRARVALDRPASSLTHRG